MSIYKCLTLTPSFQGLSTSERCLPVRLCPWLLESAVPAPRPAFMQPRLTSLYPHQIYQISSNRLTSLECIGFSENFHKKLGAMPVHHFFTPVSRKISRINWRLCSSFHEKLGHTLHLPCLPSPLGQFTICHYISHVQITRHPNFDQIQTIPGTITTSSGCLLRFFICCPISCVTFFLTNDLVTKQQWQRCVHFKMKTNTSTTTEYSAQVQFPSQPIEPLTSSKCTPDDC